MTNEQNSFQIVQQEPSDTARQLIVQFETSLSQVEMNEILGRLGTKMVNTIKGDHLVVVEVPFVGVATDIQTALNATEGVVFAEPNGEVSIPKQPEAESSETPPADAPVVDLPKITD